MKLFNSIDELPPDTLIGWEKVREVTGCNKHVLLKFFHKGEFPQPLGKVALRNKFNHKHWAMVWDCATVYKWAGQRTL